MWQHIALLGGVAQELISFWDINLYFIEECAPNGFPCYFPPQPNNCQNSKSPPGGSQYLNEGH